MISHQEERVSEIIQIVSAIVISLLAYGLLDFPWVTAFGVAVIVYSFVWYIESLGKSSAILQIMIVIATMQWILGPIIAYHFGGETLKYRMYVEEDVYMDFAVPAVTALLLGLRLVPVRVDLSAISNYIKESGLGLGYIYLLIFIGLVAEAFLNYMPSVLLFIVYLLAQLKYIGLLYIIASEHKKRWLFTFAVFMISLVSSAETGFFHGMILWSALIFSYICVAVNISRSRKFMVLILGASLIISLQAIKADYRKLIESGIPLGKTNVSVLIDMIINSSQYTDEEESTDIGALNARLNQGWIISAVMNHIQEDDQFLWGDTVISAFSDSLLPRFIVEKRVVRVSENFRKYTGLAVKKNTSMGISILGEAYVNFAVFGGVIFMFFWGLFITSIMKHIVTLSRTYPTIVLWIPLIFLQMVKAETELVVVINHGLKTSVAIIIFFWMSQKIFGWKV